MISLHNSKGMPDFAHYEDEVYRGKSRSDRAKESSGRELTRYVFPRPFALTSLPHKDISMQSIENDDGEFRMYQVRNQLLNKCCMDLGSSLNDMNILLTMFHFYYFREYGECNHCQVVLHLVRVL
jgi:hypothetical protein